MTKALRTKAVTVLLYFLLTPFSKFILLTYTRECLNFQLHIRAIIATVSAVLTVRTIISPYAMIDLS